MNTAKTIDMNVTFLLENTNFLRYVLDADSGLDAYWARFEQERPHFKEAISRAKHILQHLDNPSDYLSADEIERLKERIKCTLGM